jgi:hypothetical protein
MDAANIDRGQLLLTGTRNPGWSVLEPGAQILRINPDDDEVRLLCAQSLHALGLADLAARIAEHISDPTLLAACQTLLSGATCSTQLQTDQLIAQARANFDSAGIEGENAIAAWLSEGAAYHAASDGNIVRRPKDANELTDWTWLADLRGGARRFCQQHLAGGQKEPIGPVTIEGICPPWIAQAVHIALPQLADGYRPLIHLIQRDPAELAEGFALADLTGLLERTRVFTGEDATDTFAGFVRSRFAYPATGPVIPQPVRTPLEPPIAQLVRTLGAEQKNQCQSLHRKLVEREQQRDSAYWSNRLAQDRPKRVLIPTCRYSTFIKHASADLALAFEALGWKAQVLIEPDDHSRFSSIAYHQAQLDFDPDLIILINYPRAARADAFPTQTPFVCWIQDAMPHLFDERIGRGQGERDFIFGHVYPKLFREFGYRPERATSLPVVASEAKFHSGSASAKLHERFDCELAYVSHHSETPQVMHARLCAEAGDPQIVSVLNEMRRLLGQRYAEITCNPQSRVAKSIPADAWANIHSSAPTPRILGQLREQYLMPILERVLRHEMLEWAAEVTDRRGWRLRIYGRGWDEHETLGRFAAGELAHGEELRAAYQCAAVHLHASMSTLVHQRVMECALSGGLPMCRLVAPNLGASRQSALYALVRAGVAPDNADGDGTLFYTTENHEPLQRYASILASVNMPVPEQVTVHPGVARHMRQYGVAFEGSTAELLLGDLGAGTFQSAAQLEAAVHRAITQPQRRQARSESIAARVRERFTHEVAARHMAQLVLPNITAKQSAA